MRVTHHSPHGETKAPHPQHPLHRHRPVVTMAIGFGIILAIAAAVLVSTRVKNSGLGGAKKQNVTIDTTKWKKYADKETGLSFSYPDNWNVEAKGAGTNRLITVSAKKDESLKITIYASKEGYLGFEGLPQETISLAGYAGVRVSPGLLGFSKDGTFYTLDAGLNTDATPAFQELVKTIQFSGK